MKINAINKMANKAWDTMVNLSPTGKIATSLILKDAVGCCLYVGQARRNEKFTPQQRADVANYDLANGVINIGLQLLAVKPIENSMKKVVDGKVMKHFFNNLDKRLADPNNKKVMKLLKNKGKLAEGAVALLSVIICQYFIKRCVSPFFSVPVGEKTKQWGLIKPKLYPGETMDSKENASTEKDKQKFDVMCCDAPDTNLVHRAKNHYNVQTNA
ncbi:hypothetical protein IJZ97_04435 [bacterium]|nr:hypothetical protein [bacterium]